MTVQRLQWQQQAVRCTGSSAGKVVLVDGSAKEGYQLQPWAVIYWNMLLQVSGKLTGNRGVERYLIFTLQCPVSEQVLVSKQAVEA